MRKIICMIGASGSGKSTAAKIIEKEYGFKYVTSSSYVKQLSDEIKKYCGYRIDINVLIGIISEYHDAGFNGFMKNIFERTDFDNVVWDSCLNVYELELVIDRFDEIYYLCMTAPFKQRMKRIMERGTYSDASLDEVIARTANVDTYEKSLGLGELMIYGDWYINASTLGDLKTEIKNFFAECVPTSLELKKTFLSRSFFKPIIKKEDIIAYQNYMSSRKGKIW